MEQNIISSTVKRIATCTRCNWNMEMSASVPQAGQLRDLVEHLNQINEKLRAAHKEAHGKDGERCTCSGAVVISETIQNNVYIIQNCA